MKIKKTLRSKRGESLMEAVVSMLILGILLTTIVSIIRFSSAMTVNAMADAADAQERMNDIILGVYDVNDERGTSKLTFSASVKIDSDTTIEIGAAHEIDYNTEVGIVAFSPSDNGD